MFLLDRIVVNGKERVRKRRVCGRCHRVRVTFTPGNCVCDRCVSPEMDARAEALAEWKRRRRQA